MSVRDHVLCVLRAHFWLHFWREHILAMIQIYPDLYSLQRSFISPASFHIFNHLCDTLVLLVIAHAQYYPDQAFCPWLYGTDFVEHFFGLACMILPNFTYGELLKMVQNIMVRQRILLSGKFKEKREKQSGVGYILDFDAAPLSPEDFRLAVVTLTPEDINKLVELGYKEAEMICKDLLKIPVARLGTDKRMQLVAVGINKSDVSDDWSDDEDDPDDDPDDNELEQCNGVEGATIAALTKSAARDTARYSALCDDLDDAVAEAQHAPPMVPPSTSDRNMVNGTQSVGMDTSLRSELVDGEGKISIERMLIVRRILQRETTTKSERVIRIDPKFALRQATDETDPRDENGKLKKMTTQEASQRVRVIQALAKDAEKEKKVREIRWQNFSKGLQNIVPARGLHSVRFARPNDLISVTVNISTRNINDLFFLKRGSFIIVCNNK